MRADLGSFRRPERKDLGDRAPDHSTISRFRKALIKHGLTDRVFAEVMRQLYERGLILCQATSSASTTPNVSIRCSAISALGSPSRCS